MPVDLSGWCCGLVVWLGGTVWAVTAIRQSRAHKRPIDNRLPGRQFEGPPVPLVLVAFAITVALFAAGVALAVGWDLLYELLLKARR